MTVKGLTLLSYVPVLNFALFFLPDCLLGRWTVILEGTV